MQNEFWREGSKSALAPAFMEVAVLDFEYSVRSFDPGE
jgi:hypothetical protein